METEAPEAVEETEIPVAVELPQLIVLGSEDAETCSDGTCF